MSGIPFDEAKKIVLKAASVPREQWTDYDDQHELVGLIAQNAREAKIAATQAYDALLNDKTLLKGLQGDRRKEKFDHPETFTTSELQQIGRHIKTAREANKDKVLTSEPLVRMAKYAAPGRFSGPGAGGKSTSEEEEYEEAGMLR